MARVAIDAKTVEERLQRVELALGIVLDFIVKPEIIALTAMPKEIQAICHAYLKQIDKELQERDMEDQN